MGIEPNLIWCRHTDQLKACNVPVTDHSPVFHPVPYPTKIENQVAKRSDKSKTVSSETVDQSANSAAEYSVSTPLSQVEHVPVKRYPTKVQKPPTRLNSDFAFLNIEHCMLNMAY